MDVRTSEFRKKRDILLWGVLGSLWNVFIFLVIGSMGALSGSASSFMFPFLALFFLVMPLPYIYLINKHGHSAGTSAIAVTAVLNLILMGFMGFFYSLVSFGLIAITLGGALRERIQPRQTLLISIAASVVSGLILYYIGLRYGLNTDLRTIIESSYTQESLAKYPLALETRGRLVDIFLSVMPGVICSTGIVLGLINYYLAHFILNRQGLAIARIQPMKYWDFPRWVALVFILLGIVQPTTVTSNLLIVLFTILTLEGVMLCIHLFDRWGINPRLRNLILICSFPILSVFLYIIGMVDNLFKLRFSKRKYEED